VARSAVFLRNVTYSKGKRVMEQRRFTRNWKAIEGTYRNCLRQTIPNIEVGKREKIKINN
jgi:hypothetical protein